MDVQPSTKSYQLPEGEERVKQPPDKALPVDHAGSPPLSPQFYDLWLDDTDKNVGSNLPLPFKLHKIWSVDSQENH